MEETSVLDGLEYVSLVRRYCGLPWNGGPPETWAYRYYDELQSPVDNTVTPVDVLAASALHGALSRRELAFFNDRQRDLTHWLRGVPNISLAEASSDLLDRLAGLARFEPDVPLPLLTKVLHRKRPQLIPLVDRNLVDFYRLTTGERKAARAWPQLVNLLQMELKRDRTKLRLDVVADSLRRDLDTPVPSSLRILDIAVWMDRR